MPSLSTTVLLLGPIWAAYFLLAWLIAVAKRPRPAEGAPPTPDLPSGPPPAVVNYLVHGCRTTADAPIGTLVDLAARHYLELFQPGTDAEQVLIRVRTREAPELTAYERSVLDRVVEVAGDRDWVPLAELSVHYAENGYLWSVQFARDVAADARKRRLVRDDDGWTQIGLVFVGFLLSVATACAVPMFVISLVTGPDPEQVGPAGGLALLAVVVVLIGVMLTLLITIFAKWFPDDDPTAAGEEATGRWLGVAQWLRAHKGLADLPTASVAVWDRYLAYGAALGLTPVVSDAVDLAVGDRATLWSTYTGTRRQIRTEYRRRGRGVGFTPTVVIVYGLLWLAIVAAGAYTLVRWRERLGPLATAGLALLGIILAGRALYRIGRALTDLLGPIEMTGLVVRHSSFPWFIYLDELERVGGVPFFWPQAPIPGQLAYYLVVDDGRADVAPLWTVTYSPGHRRDCHVGDTVRLTGYRWCRTVRDITVLTPAPEPKPRPRPVPRRARRPRRRPHR